MGYLNEVGRKLKPTRYNRSLWFKGYLNEVGRKLNRH